LIPRRTSLRGRGRPSARGWGGWSGVLTLFEDAAARAITSAVVQSATALCVAMSILVQRDRGRVSVGEKATTLVKPNDKPTWRHTRRGPTASPRPTGGRSCVIHDADFPACIQSDLRALDQDRLQWVTEQIDVSERRF
jgi:hypothetical protein